MKPEMERLLELFDEAQHSPAAEQHLESHFDHLNSDYPGLSREQLRRIVRTAYLRWLRAGTKPPTIPPSA